MVERPPGATGAGAGADADAADSIRILPTPSVGSGGSNMSSYVPFRPDKWLLPDGSARLPFQGSGDLWRSGVASFSSGIIDTPSVRWLTVSPRRITRQTHTKSRNGCNSCKARRIKCDESRPVCGHCAKRKFQCEWPDLQVRETRPPVRRDPVSTSEIIRQPSSAAVFAMQDFRLFYHFINKAYPPEPMANDSIWTHEIPNIAHNYDFLMHSLLALSAADLVDRDSEGPELACAAISHRVKAIKSLNQAIASGVQSFEAGNAMLGTCYTLLFQSTLLEDGLPEFITFLRGIVLVAFTMGMKKYKFLFHSMLGLQKLESMEPYLQGSLGLSPERINAAITSLEAFGPIVERQYEQDFHKNLIQTARLMNTSSKEAYKGIMGLYQAFSWTMTNEEFRWFINPKNEIGQLLQCHFVAVQLLFAPVLSKGEHKKRCTRQNPTAHWVNGIHKNIPLHLQHYVEWPMAMSAKIRAEDISKQLCRNDINDIEIVREDDADVESCSVSEMDDGNDSRVSDLSQ